MSSNATQRRLSRQGQDLLAAALEDPENITSVLASLPRPPWKKDNPRVERRQTRGRKAEGSTAAERENAAVGSTSNDADDSKFVPVEPDISGTRFAKIRKEKKV